MAVLLKRQLDESEKQVVLLQHGKKCFATGHPIPDGEPIHFDHIRAFALRGQSEVDNIAPMCAQHNQHKGMLPLFDYRTKLRLEEFFSKGDRLTLKDLLQYLKEKKELKDFAQPVSLDAGEGSVKLESAHYKASHSLYACPTTGWKYFYATLPIELVDSDDDEEGKFGLQPRYLLFDKVFELFRHFQRHPVLQPSVGRIDNNRIKLFDGQHKAAALLWNNRQQIECKVYLDPDIELLNNTNIAAHEKYAQTRFFASILVMKLGRQFGHDFEVYKQLEDGKPKSEAAFMNWLRSRDAGSLTTAELNKRFRSFLYDAVLQDEDNRLVKLVSATNRGSDEKPITQDMLQKSLFAQFMYQHPVDDSLASDMYRREAEVKNMVWLMNAFYDLGLNAWDPKAAASDDAQRKLERILRSKSMMAWSEILGDAICGKLDLIDAEDRERPFYRALSEQNQKSVKLVIERLINWKMWSGPANDDIDRILSDNKSEVKKWFKDKGLTTGYLMGASI